MKLSKILGTRRTHHGTLLEITKRIRDIIDKKIKNEGLSIHAWNLYAEMANLYDQVKDDGYALKYFDFGKALEYMTRGRKLSRTCWDESEYVIYNCKTNKIEFNSNKRNLGVDDYFSDDWFLF